VHWGDQGLSPSLKQGLLCMGCLYQIREGSLFLCTSAEDSSEKEKGRGCAHFPAPSNSGLLWFSELKAALPEVKKKKNKNTTLQPEFPSQSIEPRALDPGSGERRNPPHHAERLLCASRKARCGPTTDRHGKSGGTEMSLRLKTGGVQSVQIQRTPEGNLL